MLTAAELFKEDSLGSFRARRTAHCPGAVLTNPHRYLRIRDDNAGARWRMLCCLAVRPLSTLRPCKARGQP